MGEKLIPRRIIVYGADEHDAGRWSLVPIEFAGFHYVPEDLVPQWQPIETAPEGEHVLAVWQSGFQAVAEVWDGEWYDPHASRRIAYGEDPTHWQPLQEPPQS